MFWSGKRAVARVGCRRVVMLAVALALPLVVAAQASPALAVSPQVTITCASPTNCTASGTGFTPSSQVQVQATAGTAVFSTSSLVASAPSRHMRHQFAGEAGLLRGRRRSLHGGPARRLRPYM